MRAFFINRALYDHCLVVAGLASSSSLPLFDSKKFDRNKRIFNTKGHRYAESVNQTLR